MSKAKVNTGAVPANSLAKQQKKVHIGRLVFPYAMIAPAIVLLVWFTFYPLGKMVYLSFFKYDNINEPEFIGFKNYINLFTKYIDFPAALKNTVIYTICITASVVFVAVVFAVWLQKSTFINGIAQRLMFLPYLCSGLTVAMVWSWMFDQEGILNMVLSWFNIEPLRWLNSSTTSLLCVMIVNFWKGVGYYALIMLSSVKSIPSEVLEAAELDDSGKLRTFFKIQLPMLSPQIFFLVITITLNSFKVFDSVRLLTGGGPGNSSDVLVYYIYRYAMEYGKYGLACAAGTILAIFLLILTIIYFKVMGKRVHYE